MELDYEDLDIYPKKRPMELDDNQTVENPEAYDEDDYSCYK